MLREQAYGHMQYVDICLNAAPERAVPQHKLHWSFLCTQTCGNIAHDTRTLEVQVRNNERLKEWRLLGCYAVWFL
jgi:hypothetical protein